MASRSSQVHNDQFRTSTAPAVAVSRTAAVVAVAVAGPAPAAHVRGGAVGGTAGAGVSKPPGGGAGVGGAVKAASSPGLVARRVAGVTTTAPPTHSSNIHTNQTNTHSTTATTTDGGRRARRAARSELVAAFCAANRHPHHDAATSDAFVNSRYHAGAPVSPLVVMPQPPRSPPFRHTLATTTSTNAATVSALSMPAMPASVHSNSRAATLTVAAVASSSSAGAGAAAAAAAGAGPATTTATTSAPSTATTLSAASLTAAGGGSHPTDAHQKDWKSLSSFGAGPGPAAPPVPVPPLPWGYDDFTLPVGTVVTDPRLPLVLDAQGAPILPYSFRPLTIRGVTLKNRIGVSPMCQYSCDGDGHLTDWHVMHLGKFAAAGAGLVMAEMTAVQARGRISPFCSGLWKDSQIAPLARVAAFVHSQGGCKLGVQLAHAGRKASQLPPFMIRRGGPINALRGAPQHGWHDDVVAPSAVAWDKGWIVPKELTVAEIQQLVDDFAAAAVRADRAGVDVLELHGAHGYLINAFLSPLSNTRTDAYGGSFDHRIRFLVEVVTAVRAVWPDTKPLFVRLSCVDWVDAEPAWDMRQTVALVHRLLALGVDVIDCSSGGNSPKQRIVSGPGYQVPFSAALQQANTKIVTAAVGEITTPQQVEDIVCTGKADIVLLGRQFLAEPHFVLRAAKELKVPIAWAPQYLRAKL